jgi:hypothetical protein
LGESSVKHAQDHKHSRNERQPNDK